MSEASPRLLDPTARIQIYFQGLLDGACFLYASANAYKALTGKRVTRDRWNQAISTVPDPGAFLGGPGATQLHYEEAQERLATMLAAFADRDETFALERLDQTAGLAEIGGEVSAESVVIVAYGGPTEFQHPQNHIVCGVATDEGEPGVLHVACSTAFWDRYLSDGEYSERHHPHLQRWSNDSLSIGQPVTIAPNFRWRITLGKASPT